MTTVKTSLVMPIGQVINVTRRRRDDYDWDGYHDKARLEEKELEHLLQQQERGELWHPNF